MDNQNGIIKNIKIQGFKSINKLDLNLNALNIIIGSNGVGKSNFISAFKFLNQLVNKTLQDYVISSGGADKFLYFGSKNTDTIGIYVDFNVNQYCVKLQPSYNDTLVINKEVCGFSAHTINYAGDDKKTILTDKLSYESNLPRPGTFTINEHVAKFLSNYKIYHFHDTSKDAKVKKSCSIDDNIMLSSDASNIGAMLYLFKNNYVADYNNIVETIQMVAPYFKDFVLIPDDNGNILPRWQHKKEETVFTFSDLSDGTLRFICLTTLLMQPLKFLPDTILIDEPELGLHPHAISTLAGMMKSVSKQHKQIIASSQSVTLINQFSPEDILIADMIGNETIIRHLEKSEVEEWLQEYQLGTIWEKNIIGGTPNDFL